MPARLHSRRSTRTDLTGVLCSACLCACTPAEQATQPSPAPGMNQAMRGASVSAPQPSNLPTTADAQATNSAAGSNVGTLVLAAGSAGVNATLPRAQAGEPAEAGRPDTANAPLTLTATDAKPLADQSFAFPASALPPLNRSPGFRWAGVPATAKSLALVFRDVSSATPPVKWILWDVPAVVMEVPANLGSSAHPTQIPGSSQLGSLGNQGYAGPCCDDHAYEWILYALDVASLAGTERMSTAQIRMDLLLQHDVAQSKPVMMRIEP